MENLVLDKIQSFRISVHFQFAKNETVYENDILIQTKYSITIIYQIFTKLVSLGAGVSRERATTEEAGGCQLVSVHC